MAAKKLAALRDKSIEDLEADIVKLKQDLGKERALISSGTRAEKPAKIRTLRRGIARALTLIREKLAAKNTPAVVKAVAKVSEKGGKK